ncbi:protein deacetylase sirtuin-6 [Seminavis robusta]|uniref:Protein deacetylase sirtuin-6 n=1 Tax=Seminavis robusta TaxID=568900 RepID=A0A9N8HAH0_9STRA|nr:protein deacetylase sirtuin-6 [Seminavis robusta]|eukprot:Sro148_g068120.1 protein deacetylase sirtuin-6 (392) ;mRNA; r:50746-51921
MEGKANLLKQLSKQPFIDHDDGSIFWHGRLYARQLCKKLTPPETTWKCPARPRDDHDDGPAWLTASEYQDRDDVLDSKLDGLVQLLMMSSKTVVYTGAGISRAAGIGQAARGKYGGSGKNKTTTAVPSTTHYALAALFQHSLVHSWVQQNHDGLPQKAGFPQEHINEVHGSWYDPSNPVVVYSGTLKERECEWMVHDAKTADLVLVLGTSLGGLNADQIVHSTARRSLRRKSLGAVLINLQQTEHDGSASIRLFGESDEILTKLLQKLDIALPASPPPYPELPRRVLVPYNADGKRSDTAKMWLDLSTGSAVKLAKGHNIAGAGQPDYDHLNDIAEPQGHVGRWDRKTAAIRLRIRDTGFLLGQWWIEAAQRGGPPTIPVVNIFPEFEMHE